MDAYRQRPLRRTDCPFCNNVWTRPITHGEFYCPSCRKCFDPDDAYIYDDESKRVRRDAEDEEGS